jgi:PhnB protein
MPGVNPYLTFDGNCMEAFTYYRSVFGGEFEDLSPFSDMPPDVPSSPEDADKLMHVSLPLGEGQVLMGSDRPSTMGAGTFGNNVAISIAPETSAEGRRVFEALADGGEVIMPYEQQFWGADYGMCTDRFGIHWMVNYTPSSDS